MGRKIMLHLHTDVGGKKPSPGDIMTGELAINYAANGETLYIKNSEEAIAEFKDDKYYQKQLSEKADKAYVDNSIAGLVDGAPETLDTLNELAAALNDNADILDVLNQSISNKQDTITDLETIRQGAAKGATALQSYTETDPIYLKDKPNIALKSEIPDISGKANVADLTSHTGNTSIHVTASDKSVWNGKQDAISDLETIRQGAAKGATALQSYTEQYKGTVTSVKINGTNKNPSNGVVDLGTVITSHQDISGKQDKLVSGTNIKTINGESILGRGDITITSSGGSGGAYPEVNHGTGDTTFTLTPNTFHVWDEVTSLTLNFGNETSGVANEYLFQFTSGPTATSLTLPNSIKWANDNALTINTNMIYQVSILRGLASVLEFNNPATLPPGMHPGGGGAEN